MMPTAPDGRAGHLGRAMDPATWSSLGGLFVIAQRLVEARRAGQHPSIGHGPGEEFFDYRPYAHGEDASGVDWRLWGRTDRLYVKRRQRLSDLSLTVLIDASASMRFQSWAGVKELDGAGRAALPSKLTQAAAAAATLGVLAVRAGDRLSVGLYRRRLIEWVPPAAGLEHLRRCCAAIERIVQRENRSTEQPETTDAEASLGQAMAAIGRRRGGRPSGVLVVLSDTLDEPVGLLRGLGRWRQACGEAWLLRVLSPDERTPPPVPRTLRLTDPETLRRVDAEPAAFGDSYARALSAHLQTVRQGCLDRGVRYAVMDTDRPILEGLRPLLRRR